MFQDLAAPLGPAADQVGVAAVRAAPGRAAEGAAERPGHPEAGGPRAAGRPGVHRRGVLGAGGGAGAVREAGALVRHHGPGQ